MDGGGWVANGNGMGNGRTSGGDETVEGEFGSIKGVAVGSGAVNLGGEGSSVAFNQPPVFLNPLGFRDPQVAVIECIDEQISKVDFCGEVFAAVPDGLGRGDEHVFLQGAGGHGEGFSAAACPGPDLDAQIAAPEWAECPGTELNEGLIRRHRGSPRT